MYLHAVIFDLSVLSMVFNLAFSTLHEWFICIGWKFEQVVQVMH